MPERTIGVFDSGIGGKSVANAIQAAFPDAKIIYVNDKQHVPYGDKTPQEVLGFVAPILQDLESQGCDIIVVACNTVTTRHITRLRQVIGVPLVGIEPMVKPAVATTTTGVIAVCATPSTLASARYAELKRQFAQDVTVLEPDCSNWAYMIEHNQVNHEFIRKQIDDVCAKGADVIVLGCTHYHWIYQEIQNMAAGRAVVIQPEEAIIRQVTRILYGRIS